MNREPSKPMGKRGWRSIVEQHRIMLSAVFVLFALVFAQPTRSSLLWGLPWIMLGEALRIWASGHIHKMAEVTRTGPYALCRHPLYLGHALITTGFLIASANAWLFLAGLAVFAMIFMPTMDREEQDLLRVFGDEYRRYMEQVPRFFPRLNAGGLGAGCFDWGLVSRHREWNNVLGLFGGLVGMALLGWLRGTL